MNEIDLIPKMPRWFRRLSSTRPVFGVRKDKIVLEIFHLGGMELLMDKCGFRFGPKEETPVRNPPIKILRRIKRDLVREQSAALRQYQGLRKARLELSTKTRQTKTGIISGRIEY